MGRRRRRRNKKNKDKEKPQDEMQNRRVFYQERPHYIKPDDSESIGEISPEQKIFMSGDNITFSLTYLDGPSPLPVEDRLKEVNIIQSELRYFRCPGGVTIQHLKKLLKAKYELRGNNYRIDIFYKDEALNDEYTLLDISYIYLWKTTDNLSLTYKIYVCPAKRRRRRYFGGVDELPAHYTPLSILQSRLGILAENLPKDMSEGRRHLRSDIEKKRKEIEMKILEERRLSERELRSHDEKRKEKANTIEVKKKDKNEDKKKNKDGKNEEKKDKKKDKESKNHDDMKKDKGGEEKKEKKKKKLKEGRCQEEKRKEKDDKEDKDERRKDRETKEDRNREMKKVVNNKRKREGGEGDKRKRVKRDEIKEKVADKRERNGDVYEKTVSGEATAATASEPAPSPTSTSTQSPRSVQPSSASDPPQSSTSADECSVSTSAADSTTALSSNSTSASTSTSEPGSTEPTSTTTENEQKTDESAMEGEQTPVSSQPTSSRQRKATPPKGNEGKEIQLQISESGVMSMSPVVENPGVIVKTVEERVCVRVTRRSSITGATSRDEGLGNREMRKRGWNGKSDEGSSVDSKRKRPLKSSKIYKTIRRSPNVWHPSFPKEKLRSTLMNDTEESKKPVKFFKLRNKARFLEKPSSDVKSEKPVKKDPTVEEDEEEEELPQHEIEREEAKVEPESAQVAKSDEIEEKKIKEEKRRIEEEEERKKKKEEKRKYEEDDKTDPTSTNNKTGFKEDPKTFGPLDKEDKYSTIVGANAPDLPNNLKGDKKTFGPLEKEDKGSTMVGANAPDLPKNLKQDPKIFRPLDEEDKRSTMFGASAPDLPTNLKGDSKFFGPLVKEDRCTTMVGASAPNLPTNLKGDLKSFGLLDKEDRCSKVMGASAPNLLTNPFIPNSNHFLFSDVTLPPNSGNFTQTAESKYEKSILGKVVPRIGIGGIGGAGLGVGDGNGSDRFKKPVPNGSGYPPMCFLKHYRLVYPYQTYPAPDTDPLLRTSHLPPFGNMGGFNPVSGFHASLPPCINNLSSPHQNVQVVSLVSRKKIKDDDSTKESIDICDDSLNSVKTEDKDRKKRRGEAETEVMATKPAKGTKMEIDEKEEDEDDEKVFVAAKRKRDEKGSREKEYKEENLVKKEKFERWDKEKGKGENKTNDEGLA